MFPQVCLYNVPLSVKPFFGSLGRCPTASDPTAWQLWFRPSSFLSSSTHTRQCRAMSRQDQPNTHRYRTSRTCHLISVNARQAKSLGLSGIIGSRLSVRSPSNLTVSATVKQMPRQRMMVKSRRELISLKRRYAFCCRNPHSSQNSLYFNHPRQTCPCMHCILKSISRPITQRPYLQGHCRWEKQPDLIILCLTKPVRGGRRPCNRTRIDTPTPLQTPPIAAVTPLRMVWSQLAVLIAEMTRPNRQS